MSAGQKVGPLDREGRSLFQPPLPPDEATRALAAAAGVSTVGLRPSFVTPAAAHSHPDCRAILILIVAPHARKRAQWAESSAAEVLKLTEADLAAIEAAVPKGAAKGERYPAQAMAHLDSEKRG